MKYIVRDVVDRRQDFRESPDRPFGCVVETLSCGHEHIEVITYEDAFPTRQSVRHRARIERDDPSERHVVNARRRRCGPCLQAIREGRVPGFDKVFEGEP